MASRKWGMNGVTALDKVTIDQNTCDQIRLQAKHHRISQVPEEFFGDLVDSIAQFNACCALKEASKPATVRKNLKEAIKAALILNDKLNRLDGNSRLLLDEAGMPLGSLQHSELNSILTALSNAAKLAREYGNARLNDAGRVILATGVARAIERHLGKKASATKEGLFESMLAITLKAATGVETKDVHDLACRAVSLLRKEV